MPGRSLGSLLVLAALLALVPTVTFAKGFQEKEVLFFSRDVRLAGTIAQPDGPGPFPGVVLVPESGPVDRDESWGKGNGTFRELAHHLADNGFAVLRYDPRGVPKSGGDFLGAGLYNFAQDAANALNYLKTLKGIDRQKVFAIGHGYGAKAAIIAGLKTPDITGVVLLAGIYDKEPEHRERIMRFQLETDGKSQGEIDKVLAQHREYVQKIAFGRYFQYEDYFLDPTMADWLVQAMQLNPQPPVWWRDNMLFEPTQAAARLPCGLLMVHGENDYLVETQRVTAAQRTIKKLGKEDVELKVFPGLNHRFVPAVSRQQAYKFECATVLTKSDTSYPIELAVLAHIHGWLKGRLEKGKGK
ncbi:MAG: alpha/beta hydrolase [Candidatus Riflebacteria bacterium]|nr:alpha/beta hydrolase [Candidatus Riflebacteria bacterium]